MYDPSNILTWICEHVEGMRLSRCKTLACIVSAAMVMKGVGVLALGRAMESQTTPKHCIKRVWRFLRNEAVETEAVHAALFRSFLPKSGPVFVLADWTDLHPFNQLVFSLPRDGRALPFLSLTVRKGCSEKEEKGLMVRGEQEALEALARICPPGIKPVLVADRGFGHPRWLGDIQKRGWRFVQRLSHIHQVAVEQHMGSLKELGIRRGRRPKDWGWGTMDEQGFGPIRLVTVFERASEEAWYLVTNQEDTPPAEIVRHYKRRMWTEAMFRDLKNRDWGLGLDQVRLSEPERHDRHFLIIALAYIFLCAFGAIAEHLGIDKHLKANTRKDRVMSLARIGNYFLQVYTCYMKDALWALRQLPT